MTDPQLLERVARAILGAEEIDPTIKNFEECRGYYEKLAQAAIEAYEEWQTEWLLNKPTAFTAPPKKGE